MNNSINTLVNIYEAMLGRQPDPYAIQTYLPLIQQDIQNILIVEKEIRESQEFNNIQKIDILLPCPQEYQQSYNSRILDGKDFLSNKKIAIIGLARNIEHKINHIIDKLVDLGSIASSYKIIVFENDSTDNTKNLLNNKANKNKNIIILSENNNRPQFGPVKDRDRTNALAEYRNKLKDYVSQHLKEYDFTIVTDMDFVDFSTEGCYNSFGWFAQLSEQIDAISGNSFEFKYVTSEKQKSLWNYDSWAFRMNWWNEIPNYYSMTYYNMLWFGFFIMPPGLMPIPVNSAFGGMTIYKNEYFINADYGGEDCEHAVFHYNLKTKFPKFQLYLNPSQRMLL